MVLSRSRESSRGAGPVWAACSSPGAGQTAGAALRASAAGPESLWSPLMKTAHFPTSAPRPTGTEAAVPLGPSEGGCRSLGERVHREVRPRACSICPPLKFQSGLGDLCSLSCRLFQAVGAGEACVLAACSLQPAKAGRRAGRPGSSPSWRSAASRLWKPGSLEKSHLSFIKW